MSNLQVRGIRQGINSGVVLGRKSPGVGATEQLSISDLTTAIVNTGQVITSGGANPQQWTAGAVASVSGGLSVAGGVLTDEWNAGTVTSIGAGLTLIGGNLATALTPPIYTFFPQYANDAAAATGGILLGQLYWNGSAVVQRRT